LAHGRSRSLRATVPVGIGSAVGRHHAGGASV